MERRGRKTGIEAQRKMKYMPREREEEKRRQEEPGGGEKWTGIERKEGKRPDRGREGRGEA